MLLCVYEPLDTDSACTRSQVLRLLGLLLSTNSNEVLEAVDRLALQLRVVDHRTVVSSVRYSAVRYTGLTVRYHVMGDMTEICEMRRRSAQVSTPTIEM